ncbi:hypothetical protein CLV59_11088 [Chitinophaga dinghuensis]|uniref:Uncharacterized protein n=1 Tax=Chitinophaga dinghuensis TaxID=1539050 RepID=A0A327VKL9_9BACT|nr:hypothetical protein CLV59_11088 [Chitinophaga dinghuensis]
MLRNENTRQEDHTAAHSAVNADKGKKRLTNKRFRQ